MEKTGEQLYFCTHLGLALSSGTIRMCPHWCQLQREKKSVC